MEKVKSTPFYCFANNFIINKLFLFLLVIVTLLSNGFFIFRASAETINVTEDITTDTHWVNNGSVYVVSSPILIAENATLFIDEGVVVKFDQGSGLMVDGKIVAQGSTTSPIYFTSIMDDSVGGDTNGDGEDSSPNENDWDYILIESPTQKSTLNNVVERYSNLGPVLYNGGSVNSENFDSDKGIITFHSDSTFSNLSAPSIELYEGSKVLIENSHIVNDNESAIAVENGSYLNIKNSKIESNNNRPIQIFQNSTADFNNVQIVGNLYNGTTFDVFNNSTLSITASSINSYNGFEIFQNSTLNTKDLSLECGNDGVEIFNNANLNISGGTMSCLNDGVVIYNEVKANIDGVKISNALDAGITAFSNTDTNPITVTKSEITGNNYGFFIFNSLISAHQNSIHDNFTNGAFTFVPTDLDFASNYWGDPSGPSHSSNPNGVGDTVSDNILFTPFLMSDPLAKPTIRPVLIIPGVLGTEISDGDTLLWADVLRMNNPFNDDSFMDPLQFNNNLNPVNLNLTLNEVIREKPFFNYIDHLITDLKSQNYTEGQSSKDNIFTFPYDWRYGVTGKIYNTNITTVDLLKQKINAIKQQTGSDKVDVVAHSTGGLLLKKYVIDNLDDSHIDKAIFVGVPNTGAPQAIKTLLKGSSFGNPFLNPLEMKKLAENMPVIYDLSPSQEYYNKKGSYVKVIDKNFLLNTTNTKDLNFNETNNFITNDHKLNFQALTNANNLHTQDFDNFDLRTARVDVYAIDGCKAGTVGKIIENRIHNINSSDYFTSYSQPELTPGDGTVPLESATNLPIDQSHKYYALKADHSKMPSQDGIRQKIVDILSGGNSTISDKLITQDISECKLNGKAISIYSPVDIDITDNQGNHSGLVNGSIQNDIPNASFEKIDDHKFIYLPNNDGQIYNINLKGTDKGTFTLKNENISGNNVTQTEVFSNLPVTTSLSGQVNLGSNTSLAINNGNGNIQTILPSATVDANQSQDIVFPVTTLNIVGEQGDIGSYRSNVTITLKTIDPIIIGQENQTSGILNTTYNLDDTETKIYNSPLLINTEGSHTIKYFSTDKAGNNELEKSITFTIDKKSPEPIISIDPTTKDLKIESSEVGVKIIKDSNNYILTDLAGNTTKLFFQKTFLGKSLTYAKLTGVQYNKDSKINLPDSSFVYLWNILKNPQVLLSQTIAVNNTYLIEAVYDTKKNETTVLLKKKGDTIQKKVFTGLHISKLTLNKGVVGYEL
jgi:pimeloyl-ACP methyl ester carboxylesterase